MKKLLLAAAILVLSATAMATGETASDTLTVSGNYIIPITVDLNTASLDFKDVFVGSEADVQTVTANLTGETGETFAYNVTTTADRGVKLTDATGNGTIAEGVATFNFGIDMDHSKLYDDVSGQVVTVTVNYNAIDDTVVVTAPAPAQG
ncbi:MAG: hypothetical protein WBG30_01935 [Psychrilyobacter sp.]|uniref:hypothetical protein n=1 Tax=Psychrilyobacter sp. TaxID=2586924 RepID=UPI003C72145D